MPRYRIPVNFTYRNGVEIEAENEAAALAQVKATGFDLFAPGLVWDHDSNPQHSFGAESDIEEIEDDV